MVYKTLHIKVNIEQHESTKNWDELRRSGSILKKDIQYSGQKKRDKKTNNGKNIKGYCDICVYRFPLNA
jgi:hypothetical protein